MLPFIDLFLKKSASIMQRLKILFISLVVARGGKNTRQKTINSFEIAEYEITLLK